MIRFVVKFASLIVCTLHCFGIMKETKPRRTWIWFFGLLAIVSVVVLVLPFIIVPIVHNLQALTAESLRAARARWERNGPKNYDLEVRKKGSVNGVFTVQVRGGKVSAATLDGQPLEPRLYPYQSMEGLFDDLERFQQLAAEPNSPRVILLARFDPEDGRIVRYVYSKAGSSQKIEVSVELRRVGP